MKKALDFSITDDGYGIHTFELSYPQINHLIFNAMKERFSDEERFSCYNRCFKDGYMICAYPKFKGMRIHLIHRYPNHYYMEIIITPWSLLRDETGTTQIFFDESALTTLEHYINICITETMGAEYNLDSFNLSRIDCCVNVMLSEDYSAARYIKLIRRSIITRSKKNEILYDSSKKNYKEKNKHNFRLITDNVTFTAYDKYYQLDDIRVDYESISDSLLRLELS